VYTITNIDENRLESIELGMINSLDNIGVTGYELISLNAFSKTVFNN
jgi:hypothetical protein